MDSAKAEKKHEQAIVLYELQRYENALLFFDEAIILNPNVPKYWNNRAACHIMLKNYYKALTDAKKSISINEYFIKGYKRLSRCHLILDDLNFALRYMKIAQKIDPCDEFCETEIENILRLKEYDRNITQLFEENKFECAIDIIDKYLFIVPESKKYKLLKAECLVLLQKYEEGCSIINPLLEITPEDEDILYVKALHDFYKGYIKRTFESLQNIKKRIPDNLKLTKLYQNAKKTLELLDYANETQQNQLNDSYIFLDEALKIDPWNYNTNKQILYQKIYVATQCVELTDNIINDCNKYLKNYSKNLDILEIRAKRYMAIQNYEDAIEDYEAILTIENTRENKELCDKAKLAFKEQLANNYKILKIEQNENNHVKIRRAYQQLHANYAADLKNADNQIKIDKINIKIERITKAYNDIIEELNDDNLLDEVSEEVSWRKVRKLIHSQDFSKASVLLGNISKNDPNNEEAIYMQTCIVYGETYILESFDFIKRKYLQIPHYEKMQKLYKKASEFYELLQKVGECIENNQPNDAYKLLTNAVKIDPENNVTNKMIYKEKIEICLKYPELKENVYKDCSLYLHNYGYNSGILKTRAYYSFENREYEDAKEDFEELYKIEGREEYNKMFQMAKQLFDEESVNNYKILRIENNLKNEVLIKRAFLDLVRLYHGDRQHWASKDRKKKLDKKLIRVRSAYNQIMEKIKHN